MRLITKIFYAMLLCISALLPFAVATGEEELLPVTVTINTVPKGEYLITVKPDGDIVLEGSDFALLGVKLNVGTAKTVSLKQLAPQITYQLDKEALALKVTADPRLLGFSVVALSKQSLATAARLTAPHAQHQSFYATYALNASLGLEGETDGTIQIPLRFGYRARGYLFQNTVDYSGPLNGGEAENLFQRLKTSVTLDNLGALTRVQLGDQSAQGGLLGGGGIYGGIGISSTRSLNPNLRSTSQSISGIIETPSDVDIFVNGRLVRSDTLTPGRFEFNNLPTSALGQEARIVIRDSFGKVQTLSQRIYNGNYALDEGESEYSYTLGLERINFKKAGLNGYADEPTFIGFHRYGFSKTFTAGYSLEANREVQNLGLDIAHLFGTSEVSLGAAISRAEALGDDDLGYAAYGIYSYFVDGFSASLNARFQTDPYRTTVDFDPNGLTVSVGANVGIRLSEGTSFNVSYDYQDARQDGISQTSGFRFQSQLGGGITWDLSGRYEANKEGQDDYQITTGLNIRFDNGPDLLIGYQDEKLGVNIATLDVQGDEIDGEFVPWRVIYNRTRNEDVGLEIDAISSELEYTGRYGVANVSYDRNLDEDGDVQGTAFARLSGGFGIAKGVSAFGRPIHDGFAVVSTGKLDKSIDGVSVRLGSEEYGVLGSNESLLVQRLTGYVPDKISVEIVGDVLDYELNRINHEVAVAPRGGRLVKVEAIRRVYVEGTISVTYKGERKLADQAELILSGPEGTQELSAGLDGLFFGENLVPGKYKLTVHYKKKTCDVFFRLAEATELLTNIGELNCAIN